MNIRMVGLLLFLSAMTSLSFKGISNTVETYRQGVISEEVCRFSEAKLQVGSTKEVADVATAALVATGHPDAELTIKVGKNFFIESNLTESNAKMYSCSIQGRDDVIVEIYFPRLAWLDAEAFVAFMASLALLIILKILFSVLIKGLQNRFIDETDRRLASVLGFSNSPQAKSPVWVEWLYKTNPQSVIQFKNRLTNLQDKVEKQSIELKTQAQEKAWREFQLIQARKFKDLAHQIRHDLRQTLGVIKSSVKTLPDLTTEKNILSGAVSSLEFMIEDLKEREFANSNDPAKNLEVIEVILAEVVAEQRAYLGAASKIQLSLQLADTELHAAKVQSALFKRVFTNLTRNAIEALPGSGAIRISVRKLNAQTVSISIEDNGSGFSADAMKNLFQKGFTTKESGSGLGLSFCKEKIREWSGTLLVDSSPGKTVIEIELPVAQLDYAFAHPLALADYSNLMVVDDHPMELEIDQVVPQKPTVIRSLADFEGLSATTANINQATIVFDLHLEGGRSALEVLQRLPSGTDYLFMTSDYLNPELLAAAEKHRFLIIPKDLMVHALECTKELASGPQILQTPAVV